MEEHKAFNLYQYYKEFAWLVKNNGFSVRNCDGNYQQVTFKRVQIPIFGEIVNKRFFILYTGQKILADNPESKKRIKEGFSKLTKIARNFEFRA